MKCIMEKKVETKKEVSEEELKLLLKKQSRVKKYKGKLKWEGNLQEMRTDR